MLEAFVLGLLISMAGSVHCVAMCGPLACSLPVGYKTTGQKIISYGAYHLGRVFTYMILGLLVGLIGKSFFIIGLQQAISVILGVGILAHLLIHKSFFRKAVGAGILQQKIQKGMLYFFKKNNGPFTFLGIGILNGLLPCGLIYFAIASALNIGDVWKGSVLMAGFGTGTIPVLLLSMLSGYWLSATFKAKIRNAIPYFMAMMAILFILRGLNLNIPYISPLLRSELQAIGCHA